MLLNIGEMVPEMTLLDQSGEPRNLAALIGKSGAVIYFYPKDNTSGCTLEAKDFERLQSTFAQLGFSIMGISKDSVKSHGNFCQKQGLTFTLLSDGEGVACEAFGVWQEKKNYGRTYMGIVRSTFVVDAAGRIVKVYPKVKTKGHAEQVLTDVKALS